MTPKKSKSEMRGRYFQALGVDPNSDCQKEKEKLKSALSRAHDLRKFEIELYWKRATYFWAFQAVSFAALGFLFKNGEPIKIVYFMIPAALGTFTALAGLLTARGSKFWQENWEAHVDVLQPDFECRLNQVVFCRGNVQFSVSRVNQKLLSILGVGWFLALIGCASATTSPKFLDSLSNSAVCWVVVGAVFLLCFAMWWDTKTEFEGQSFMLGDTDWQRYPSRRQIKHCWLIWREPFI